MDDNDENDIGDGDVGDNDVRDDDDDDGSDDDELVVMMMRCIHLHFAVSYSITCPVHYELTECYFSVPFFFLAKYQE